MVEQVDKNYNSKIDFEEFVEVMCKRVGSDYTLQGVRRAFKVEGWVRGTCMFLGFGR